MNKFILFILSILGFSSCNGLTECMYGTPNIEYRVTGNVVDEDGNPIEGIKVTPYYDDTTNEYTLDDYTVLTDKNGKYTTDFFEQTGNIYEDIDGMDNGGEFESIRVPILDKDYNHSNDDNSILQLKENIILHKETSKNSESQILELSESNL